MLVLSVYINMYNKGKKSELFKTRNMVAMMANMVANPFKKYT